MRQTTEFLTLRTPTPIMSDTMSETAQRPPKLIVVVAFDRDEKGELQPQFGPADQLSEDRAIRTARALADKHAGVIAWVRDADFALGEYGPPKVLFQDGDVPDME